MRDLRQNEQRLVFLELLTQPKTVLIVTCTFTQGGRKAVTKMESRIRELESEMDAESRQYADAQKNMRKSERRVKELVYAQEEDKKNHERMQGLIDQLQGKIKS